MDFLSIQIFATAGLFISLYFLVVTSNSKKKNYSPLCDINERSSCTKAAKSKTSHLFYFPNAASAKVAYTIRISV